MKGLFVATLLASAAAQTATQSRTPEETRKLKQAHSANPSPTADELSRDVAALLRADAALSRAELELSKAEASVGKTEAFWSKWAKITMALLVLVMAYGIWIVIAASREHYSYRKAMNRR